VAVLNSSPSLSLLAALQMRAATAREWASHVVVDALARRRSKPASAFFLGSNARALLVGLGVGLCSGAVSWILILQHGDLALAAFENADAEMVILNGHIYQMRGHGKASETGFQPRRALEIKLAGSPDDLAGSRSIRPATTRD
jgi:alpha-acetolactate decarboxylase